jgi:hypothetical protein
VKPAKERSSPLWLRIAGLILGILLLVWIPIEDTGESLVVGLAIIFCAWFAIRHLLLSVKDRLPLWMHYLLTGLIAGLSITPVALLLIAFKSGIHGHEVPDFTPTQMARVVEMTPIFTAAGILTGLGAGLLRKEQTK